jgi:hypothetical protein
MVALKTRGYYTGSVPRPTSSLREGREFVFLGSSALRAYNGGVQAKGFKVGDEWRVWMIV